MVVGSQDGQIRLYNGKQFTRANTAVPGLGAPITSVDVTYDGKWILATTKSYLMVVKTIYKVKCLVTNCMHAAQYCATPVAALWYCLADNDLHSLGCRGSMIS